MENTEFKRTDSIQNEMSTMADTTDKNDTTDKKDVPEQSMKQLNLLDVEITDENIALNVLIGYLGVAQKRGTFAINESAKIYECVKKFTSN